MAQVRIQGSGLTQAVSSLYAGWTFIEAQNKSNAASYLSGTLTVFDEYLLEADVYASGAGYGTLALILNEDTTAGHYGHSVQDGTAFVVTGAAAAFPICRHNNAAISHFVIVIKGKTQNIASGAANVECFQNSGDIGYVNALVNGLYYGGNAVQISTIRINGTTQNITGRIRVFGRNKA